jgi:voltage-gated potassium channel
VTVSTAGFGDLYPVTVEGRIIAMVMLVTGIGLFGTFTALVASWFIGSQSRGDELRAELAEVRRIVERIESGTGEGNLR